MLLGHPALTQGTGAKLQLLPKLRQRETRTYCSQQSLSCLHTRSCHTRHLEGNGQGHQDRKWVCPTPASFCISVSPWGGVGVGGPHPLQGAGQAPGDSAGQGPHQHSCSLHGWHHRILSLSLDRGYSLLFPVLGGWGVGALHCAWGPPCRTQGYVAGWERRQTTYISLPFKRSESTHQGERTRELRAEHSP